MSSCSQKTTFNTAQVCRNAPGLIIRGAKTNPETTALAASEPPLDCALCPRLMQFRHANRKAHAEYFNNPVPRFGDANGRLLILGLAPGLHGANRTGRPFTGDHAGDLLYSSLIRHGLARGGYAARADDGLELIDCLIANAVRCVPPDNKPTTLEIRTCRQFLSALLGEMANLRAVLTLGRIAHDSACKALDIPARAHPFVHGGLHRGDRLTLVASYHCSRYNTNTGVLTAEMFDAALAAAKAAAYR